MKICIYNLTTGVSFGGVEVFCVHLAEVLGKFGEDVYLFTGKGSITLSADSFRVKRYCYIPSHYIPDLGTRFRKWASRFSFAIFSFRELCRENFDIIHIHKPYDLPVACMAKSISGAKVVLGSHGTDFYFCDKLFIKEVDGIFSCSAYNAKEIWDRYKCRAKVIYNGCDTRLFRPTEPDREIIEKFRLQGKSVILTAGRLVNWKRVDILINALPLLKNRNFRVMICGTGKCKPELVALSKRLGVSDKIIWVGSVLHKELPRYLSVADVFVQVSISESFGMSICEAMAMEKPVVASRSGGVPEVVDDGKNGFLVEPGDVKRVGEYIDLLLSDKKLQQDMGKKAREKVVNVFTWDKVAERVLEGYREVCTS